MKRLPFYSRSADLTVVDYLCHCGGKWSEHEHDVMLGESHGSGCVGTGCMRFIFYGYVYEQAIIEHESIRLPKCGKKATNGTS